MYGASYRAAFNGKYTRVLFCDNDGGAEADALFQIFLNISNPTPNPGILASVHKFACLSADDLKAVVLSHPGATDTVVGGVYVPQGFTAQIQGFASGTTPAVMARVTTIADSGFNPAFVDRAVTPLFSSSIARYNSMKSLSFFKPNLDPGIAAAAATDPGSAARTSLLAPAQVNVLRLNTASPIGGLASTLGTIFLFVQAQVQLMIIHPILMPLFGKLKPKHYINIRRVLAYFMASCFALISASITSLFGIYNGFIDAKTWIYLFLASWLVITTFGVTISFCQINFGPLAPTAIGILNAIGIASAQFDAPWACLPDFFQIGRAMAMPNGIELFRCVLFGSCYNVGANIGILIANHVLFTIVVYITARNNVINSARAERLKNFGLKVSPGSQANTYGVGHAGLGMAAVAAGGH
jgi:hypothetical protein